GDLQRAQCPRVVRTRYGRPRARPEGPTQHAGRHPSPQSGARPRRSSAACGARRLAPGHGDRRAAERFDAMWNGACLDPLMTGAYPAPIAADFAPLVADGDFAAMRQPTDYLGVNYYAPMYVMHAPQSLFGAWLGAAPAGTRFTAMGWPIDAGGLTEELIRLR